jgi:CRP-like cAMP-binding protein
MAIDLVLESLRRVPVFANLTSAQIAEIGRGARRCAFRAGEVIAGAGEPGDGAYLLLSGEAVCITTASGRGPREPVEPGSLVGELAMLVEHDYRTTVVAQGWVDCLKLERSTLHEQMRADPGIARRIADAIRGRLNPVAAKLQVINHLLARAEEQYSAAPVIHLPPRHHKSPAIAASMAQ